MCSHSKHFEVSGLQRKTLVSRLPSHKILHLPFTTPYLFNYGRNITAYLDKKLCQSVFHPLINNYYKLLLLHRYSLLSPSLLLLHSLQHLGLLKDEDLHLVNYCCQNEKSQLPHASLISEEKNMHASRLSN